MSISEFLKLRNAIFIIAEEQAHAQVKKVQIKPGFSLKFLTCVSGHSSFFEKWGGTTTPPLVFRVPRTKKLKKLTSNFNYEKIKKAEGTGIPTA